MKIVFSESETETLCVALAALHEAKETAMTNKDAVKAATYQQASSLLVYMIETYGASTTEG